MDLKAPQIANGYLSNRAAIAPSPEAGIGQAASAFTETLKVGEHAAIGSMTGGVDPHSLVQALAQTELAVETAVTLRDKVVEAYQEILRMPV